YGGGRPPGPGGPGGRGPVAPPAFEPSRGDRRASDRERDQAREKARETQFERDGSGARRNKDAGGARFGVGGRAGVMNATTAPKQSRTGIRRMVEIYELPPTLTVKELADELGVGPNDIIRELIKNGVMASINQVIDYDTAEIVSGELGFETREVVPIKEDSQELHIPTKEEITQDPEAELRPPVVTIMGHVDHGKTKLLDAIRSTNVAAGEAGGITQHIGAYQVEISGKKITFLDTPGHEAFTQMRARGAQVTDIAILVVAADDGVMPQTLEALSHAKAAGVSIIVAINKIDREGANIDRVMSQLNEAGLIPEEWGGETPFVKVSAKNRIGIDDLLEMILMVSELAEWKANPNKDAIGTIIEAELDKNRGPIATVLIQNGTLNVKDYVVVGTVMGRVKALMDDKGRRIKRAEPSTPAEILGLEGVPIAGDILIAVGDEKTARDLVEMRSRQKSQDSQEVTQAITLDDLFSQIQAGKVKELRIILKADVQGSVEAIRTSLEKLSNEKVKIKILFSGTGAITESDVMLAAADRSAIIIGFNVRPDVAAKRASDKSKVDIRFYNIIYNLIDEVKLAMEGMLEPTFQDVTDGYAEVRQVFKVGKSDAFAGLFVTDGKLLRGDKVRVLRNGTVMYDGGVSSLKRFKDDVREVAAGYECGIGLDDFNDFQEGDALEFYHKEQVKTLLN
ncbi:translation initiation factor IF-2, partial [Candidatus Chlorohelix sp.]|uniref:translation initiation factor IF-2 n=1 Tax=Candidatus Chlorohelix sp. TaxID=3139201 RepID=UPI00303E5328